MKEISTPRPRSKILSARNVAIASIALSGAVHLLILPEQLSHSMVHASFFALLGAAQLLWAPAFWWRPATSIYWAGVGLSGGIVILWFLAYFLSAPYSSHTEPVDGYLLSSKILELIGLFALISHGRAAAVARANRTSMLPLIVSRLVASVIFGMMVWGGGELVELVLPGSQHGPSPGSEHSHAGGHPGGNSHSLRSVTANPAPKFQPTPDIQALTNAAVAAALAASGMNHSSAVSGGNTSGLLSPGDESDPSDDAAETSATGLPPDVQAMIALAVESALSRDVTPPPPAGLPQEIQEMVSLAVAAALDGEPALVPPPGPLPVEPAAVAEAPIQASLPDHDPAHLHPVGTSGINPGRTQVPIEANLVHHDAAHPHSGEARESIIVESVPTPLPGRSEPAATPLPLQLRPVPKLAPSQLSGSAATPGPVVSRRQQSEPSPWMLQEEELPADEQLDPKLLVFGTALAVLTLVAVVGAVKTWNDIT